jgi:hypothetical protein
VLSAHAHDMTCGMCRNATYAMLHAGSGRAGDYLLKRVIVDYVICDASQHVF